MTAMSHPSASFSKPPAIFSLGGAAVPSHFTFLAPLRRFARESLMHRVTSAHYEILCPPGAVPDTMKEFATQQRISFHTLDKKLGDAGRMRKFASSSTRFPIASACESGQRPYSVSGTTIRTKLKGLVPSFPTRPTPKRSFTQPGASRETRKSPVDAMWLVGEWRGQKSEWPPRKWSSGSATRKSRACWPPGGEISSPETRRCWGPHGSAKLPNSAAPARYGNFMPQKWRTPTSPKYEHWALLRWNWTANGRCGCMRIWRECPQCPAIRHADEYANGGESLGVTFRNRVLVRLVFRSAIRISRQS